MFISLLHNKDGVKSAAGKPDVQVPRARCGEGPRVSTPPAGEPPSQHLPAFSGWKLSEPCTSGIFMAA